MGVVHATGQGKKQAEARGLGSGQMQKCCGMWCGRGVGRRGMTARLWSQDGRAMGMTWAQPLFAEECTFTATACFAPIESFAPTNSFTLTESFASTDSFTLTKGFTGATQRGAIGPRTHRTAGQGTCRHVRALEGQQAQACQSPSRCRRDFEVRDVQVNDMPL